MESSVYSVETDVEINHWWFVGRRKLFSWMIAQLPISKDTAILDVGTGTGTNLRLLKELHYANVTGVDISEQAILHCEAKGLGTIEYGDICALPFADESFQLILATDIIEHVENDVKALLEIERVLSKDGIAIVTVPAFPFLWGLQDQVAHHKRRYKMEHLLTLVRKTPLKCKQSFYFNYILFLPILLARRLIKFFDIRLHSENQVNSPIINCLLTLIFCFDVWSARWLNPPFGVSALIVLQKSSSKK